MPITAVYATKGGQGVTTTAAALAILTAHTGARTLLVDTAHDQPAILGLPEPAGPGLGDYLQPASRTTLAQITTPIAENLDLIHRGHTDIVFATHTYGLLTGGLGHYDHVIIDTHNAAYAWTLHVDRRLLVTRPCYLALRRSTITPRPDTVVLISEHQRALDANDIEAVLGIPVTATVPYSPAIARAIDAGLLTARLPRELARALRPLLTDEAGR
jgi:cellulose biosynthesis protein BcsQ